MVKTINLLSQEISAADQTINRDDGSLLARDDGSSGGKDGGGNIEGVVLPEPNDNPYRRRITNPVRGVKKLLRMAKNRIMPPPTMDEIMAMEDRKRMKLLNATLTEEAKIVAKRFSRALGDLNFCYFRNDKHGNPVASKFIRFDFVYPTEDAIWLHVDMKRWVHGVNSDEIIKQEVINHLSRSVGHKVNVRSSAEDGIWYIVERASGMMGIPSHVQLTDMWSRFPSTATGLTIPIGMTNNRKTVYDNLDDMVHVLVAGQTGAGKSTLLNTFLCTLITRNTPDHLKLFLLDMKAGLEFQYYEGLPHLLPIPDVTDIGIVSDPDQVQPALHWLVNYEAKRRLDLIRQAGHKDIKTYNARRHGKNYMPRIVVAIDEWAMARMGHGGKEAEHELAKAVQLLRAAGIHFIVCTQTPSKDVLGVLVRANLPTRIALSCSELSASMLIVGDGSAVGLGVPGRCVFKKASATPVQTPYISEEMVKTIVGQVLSGEMHPQQAAAHDVTTPEMLLWALHENAGSLRYQTVHAHFAHRGITKEDVRLTLGSLDNTTVEIDGISYFVQPGAGSRPRKLIAVPEPPSEVQP